MAHQNKDMVNIYLNEKINQAEAALSNNSIDNIDVINDLEATLGKFDKITGNFKEKGDICYILSESNLFKFSQHADNHKRTLCIKEALQQLELAWRYYHSVKPNKTPKEIKKNELVKTNSALEKLISTIWLESKTNLNTAANNLNEESSNTDIINKLACTYASMKALDFSKQLLCSIHKTNWEQYPFKPILKATAQKKLWQKELKQIDISLIKSINKLDKILIKLIKTLKLSQRSYDLQQLLSIANLCHEYFSSHTKNEKCWVNSVKVCYNACVIIQFKYCKNKQTNPEIVQKVSHIISACKQAINFETNTTTD